MVNEINFELASLVVIGVILGKVFLPVYPTHPDRKTPVGFVAKAGATFASHVR
jgi:hypothetical protein